jgi:DNA recombination protein RmuC
VGELPVAEWGVLLVAALLATPVLLLVCVALLAAVLRRSGGERGAALLAPRIEALANGQERSERALREELARGRSESQQGARDLRVEVAGAVHVMGETLEKRVGDVRDAVDSRLREIQTENARKLEEMRATVDEKLQGTLEKRLGESFRLVSERLEAVHQGLGEMQSLANGVGDLKKVLGNVKTRGTWGEVQLGALLDQMLVRGQYEENVATRPGGSERVEFAVKLPGAEDAAPPVWLPIDAKFPLEDYQRLVDAQEHGDPAAAEEASRALEARVVQEARRIRDKYVHPPSTTDFAILFLPTEGLYAEVLRRAGLVDRLQRDHRVTVAGPTTLAAVLNSLQMGFRTLAIQKQSSEVWRLLGAVKTQFGQFGGLLEKVERKLDEASKTVGDATRKSRHIERRLGRVDALPAGESQRWLTLPSGDEPE